MVVLKKSHFQLTAPANNSVYDFYILFVFGVNSLIRYFFIGLSVFVMAYMVGCATPETNETKPAMRVSVYNKLLSIGELIKGDQLDKAQGELDELLDKGIFPAGLLNDQEKAYAYNNLAYIYYQREEYKNAIEVYKDILSLSLEPGSKDRYSALTTLAQLYILEKQIEQAELLAEQSIAEVNDPETLIHWTLVDYFLIHGDRGKAELYFSQALKSYRSSTDSRRIKFLIPRKTYRQLAVLYHSDSNRLNAMLNEFSAVRPDINHLKLYLAFNKDRLKNVDRKSNEDRDGGHANGKVELKRESQIANNSENGGEEAEEAYLPIIKVAPIYPHAALRAGLSGYCLVEYTVLQDGSVKDIKVEACEPAGYFEEPSILAAKKFKYKPKLVDGKAVEVDAVNNLFTYQLY